MPATALMSSTAAAPIGERMSRFEPPAHTARLAPLGQRLGNDLLHFGRRRRRVA